MLSCVTFLQKEKISAHPPLKKLKSLNDLDQAHDEQEIAFLKLQVLEQQSIIDELTRVNIYLYIFSILFAFSWKLSSVLFSNLHTFSHLSLIMWSDGHSTVMPYYYCNMLNVNNMVGNKVGQTNKCHIISYVDAYWTFGSLHADAFQESPEC